MRKFFLFVNDFPDKSIRNKRSGWKMFQIQINRVVGIKMSWFYFRLSLVTKESRD